MLLTPLALLDLVGLKLYPCIVGKLVGEDSTEKDFRDWTTEALVEAHLIHQ